MWHQRHLLLGLERVDKPQNSSKKVGMDGRAFPSMRFCALSSILSLFGDSCCDLLSGQPHNMLTCHANATGHCDTHFWQPLVFRIASHVMQRPLWKIMSVWLHFKGVQRTVLTCGTCFSFRSGVSKLSTSGLLNLSKLCRGENFSRYHFSSHRSPAAPAEIFSSIQSLNVQVLYLYLKSIKYS